MKTKKAASFLVRSLLAVSLCLPTAIAADEVSQRPSDMDVYEAVLRYQIKSWDLSADSYCIKIGGRDASADLLARLRPMRVKRASECRERTTTSVMEVVDKKTGKMSVIFDLDEIHWRTGSDVDVQGGYLCATECSAGGTYRVTWNGSHLVVTKFEIFVQS